MTPPTTTPTCRARRSRRVAGRVLVGAVALSAWLLAPGADAVDAGARTTSATIAGEADRALAALERWHADRNPADYVLYVQSRELTASLTATDLEIDGAALRAAWSAAPVEKQQAVLAALSQLGVPYSSLDSDPEVGFDCSGLMLWAYRQAGLELPRSSRDQFRASDSIDAEDAEPGDFVYYPGHIAMFIGVDSMVHSPNSGNDVEAAPVPTRRSVDFGDPVAGAADEG